VGGPDGLDPRCTARQIKFGHCPVLTLPHPMVRVNSGANLSWLGR